MDGVEPYVARLAQVNRHGFGFLLAYGVTWTVVFTIVLAAHFVPYSWLYGTVLYAVLALLIALVVAMVVGTQGRWGDDAQRRAGVWITSANGLILLGGGVVALTP
ncbi:MAG: hypothetical protein DI571_05080 [Arsenicicoccus sp.]|nr:MAG: hypothetical protein DI571_05080 [Arsenicicoccus sp.]